MTFVESVTTCFKKYVDFNGCAVRSEFWWWTLFTILASLLLGMISENLASLFSLATLLPTLAVGARRLHDIDRSGWWQLIGLIPIIGWIVLIIWFAQQEKRPSRFC
jgi:uncharacterized membrane protein YhaH (DUF805 family)